MRSDAASFPAKEKEGGRSAPPSDVFVPLKPGARYAPAFTGAVGLAG